MSLSVGLRLCELLVFLVALVKLLFLVVVFFFPLILTLGNEMSTLAIVIAHSLSSRLFLSISLERSSFAYEFIEFHNE
jgi:hypothetical protein